MKTVQIRVSKQAQEYLTRWAERRGETIGWVVDGLINMAESQRQKNQYARSIGKSKKLGAYTKK